MSDKKNLAVEIKDLVVEFRTDDAIVQAVSGLDLEIEKGKTLGLVGETGAGKTTTGLSILRLIPDPPGKIVSGTIKLGGEDIFAKSEKEMENLTEKYMPEIVRRIGNMAKKIGGHGGMDFLMSWRLIDCLRNGLPMDIDVYDAVAWSSIIPLSEWSVKHGSQPVLIPDFTCGSYRLNEPFV